MASSGTGRCARTARKAPQPEDMAVDCPGARKSFKRTLATLHSEAAPSAGGATLWALQGTAGNGAVARVLRSRQAMPRGLQAKLMVGAANDPLEREADRVADLVMRTGSSRSASGRAEEEDEAPIQRLADPRQDPASAFEADTAVAARLTARRGGGQPLPPVVRDRMEAGFGADFSAVRIHRDAEAANLSTGLAARAFTHGADIYFAARAYDPGSYAGRHLLAHELTHVVQQGGASLHRTFEPRPTVVAGQRGAVMAMAQPDNMVQRDLIGNIEVNKEGRTATWVQNGVTYHLNVTTDPYHVTQESRSEAKKKGPTKTHFFFKREGEKCKNAQGKGGVSGSKKKFSDLPQAVRDFVEEHFMDLIRSKAGH